MKTIKEDNYQPTYGKGSSPEIQKMQDSWNWHELKDEVVLGNPLNDRQKMILAYLSKKLDLPNPLSIDAKK